MSVLGSPSAWADLLEDILPELLQSVVDSWDTLKGPLNDAREDTVTYALCRALKHSRTLRELPVYVIPQMVELEPAEGEDLGRLDIAFLPTGIQGSPDESIYFCLECKWLNIVINGRKRPNGSEYVKHGMLRFVTGQYAKAVRHGGMVGYVLDGKVGGAIANVEDNILRHCKTLCMKPPGELLASSVLTHVPTARESFHNRQGDVPFCIHHVFFRADSLF